MEKLKNVICIYHSSDLDGICSRDIVKYAYKNKKGYSPNVNCIGWTYGDAIPDQLQSIDPNTTTIVICDISLDSPTMMSLSTMFREQGLEVIWIDHHKTAIETAKALKYNDFEGFREVGTAACELTYNYFFPFNEVPAVVKVLAAYDVWDKSTYDWETIVLPFQYGMRTCTEIPEEFLNRTSMFPGEFLDMGRGIIKYNEQRYKNICENAFEMIIDGHKAICLNSQDFSSNTFDSIYDENKHDLMLNFAFRPTHNPGELIVRCSLYTTNEDFNVGNLAKLFGGGGHVQAAGFELTMQQWQTIISGEGKVNGIEFKMNNPMDNTKVLTKIDAYVVRKQQSSYTKTRVGIYKDKESAEKEAERNVLGSVEKVELWKSENGDIFELKQVKGKLL